MFPKPAGRVFEIFERFNLGIEIVLDDKAVPLKIKVIPILSEGTEEDFDELLQH